MDAEAYRVLNFLAAMPTGTSTVTKKQLKEILTSTGGWMLACGAAYDICSKHLGVGIYKIYLEPR
jgi:hypothetical protein